MNTRATATVVAMLTLFTSGCVSPMQKRLAKYPDWQKISQHMASSVSVEGSDLVWHAFPDPNNPLHQQIWNALWKNGGVGNGFGRICNYDGLYLVTISDDPAEPVSLFYDPRNKIVFSAQRGNALSFYHGNREATASNAVALVQHLLAINSYPAFVISNATDIPHKSFTKENPRRSFEEWLLSKGIVITPPSLATINKDPDWGGPQGDAEYNVFVYRPCGGQVFRYEVQGEHGLISDPLPYHIADNIGDCWYLY